MTNEEAAIEWCEVRTRFYKAWGEALRVLGPVMAKKWDEDLLKLFKQESGR